MLDPLDALAADPWELSDLSESIAPELPVPRSSYRPEPVPTTLRISRSRRPRSRPVVPSSPPLLHWLGQHFSPGEATLWVGPPSTIETVLELLYAGVARAGGRVSLVEGANRFQPYRVGEDGRALGLDPGQVLDRIRLARAFTAYQLVALVDGWASEAHRHVPTLLVGHDLTALFESSEVPEEERSPLLAHVAETLRTMMRTAGAPLLLTLGRGLSQFPGLADRGPRLFDLVQFRARAGGLTLDALRDGSKLSVVPRSAGQFGLEEFGPTGPEEVTAWAAQFRPTDRRSRSG